MIRRPKATLAALLFVASSVATWLPGCGGSDTDLSALQPDAGPFLPHADGGTGPDTSLPPEEDSGSEPDSSTVDSSTPKDGGTDSAADGATDGGADAADAAVGPALSIDSVSVIEGNSGTTAMTFTVTLSAASAQAVTVDFASVAGTATTSNLAVGGSDFTASSGTLNFAPGDTSKTININVNGDVTAEANETLTVVLSNATKASIAQGVGTGTITNDDAMPSITIGNALVTEGNTGTTTPAVFTVTLSAASGQTVTVHAKTTDGVGAAGATAANNDFTAIADTLVTFNPGETTKTVTVTVIGDNTSEPNETFTVDLSVPTNASVGVPTGTGTIQDDDGAVLPAITIADATVSEGNAGTKPMTFTATLSAASAQTVTVDFKTTDGTATAGGAPAAGGVDYAATNGTLTFAPGVLTQNVVITINGDLVNENDETFTVDLSNATNANISKAQGTGTITNDDAVPTITIGDVSSTEGQAGTKAFTFTIALSATSGKTVSVGYATSDGTAIAGGSLGTGGQDYGASTGTINFPPGAPSQTVSIIVNGDLLNEADDTFNVAISAPVNATLGGKTTGVGTITNDDPVPQIVINDVSLLEGDTGTTAMVFNVSLVNASLGAAPSGRAVTVDYASASGTATSGTDFVATTGTLNFAAGQTTQFVTVQVNGDTVLEANETLTVGLSNATNATISDATGQGTILNDDGAFPFLNVADTAVAEGNAGTTQLTFTVSLSAAATMDVTVNYTTANGSAVSAGNLATGGQDYVPTSGTLTFTPGQTSRTVSVTVNGDVANEGDDTVLLNLLSVGSANATIQDGTGAGTITNDDALPSLSIGNATGNEGNAQTSVASFTVTLSAVSGRSVSVSYATADGSAQAGGGALAAGGQDYVAQSGTLVFAPGETTKIISVTVNGDTTFEPDETYAVTLSAPAQATLGTATGTGTITNDDTLPSITINDVSLAEGTPALGSGPTTAFAFTVTLSNPTAQTVTMLYATADGTASHVGANADYALLTGVLSIAPGATTGTFTVLVQKDNRNEGDDTFFVNLTAPTNASISDAQGLGVIINDD